MQNHVQFVVNAPYPEMLAWLSRASIGLSTMVDEHFGINVVELMVSFLPLRGQAPFLRVWLYPGSRCHTSSSRVRGAPEGHHRAIRGRADRYGLF